MRPCRVVEELVGPRVPLAERQRGDEPGDARRLVSEVVGVERVRESPDVRVIFFFGEATSNGADQGRTPSPSGPQFHGQPTTQSALNALLFTAARRGGTAMRVCSCYSRGGRDQAHCTCSGEMCRVCGVFCTNHCRYGIAPLGRVPERLAALDPATAQRSGPPGPNPRPSSELPSTQRSSWWNLESPRRVRPIRSSSRTRGSAFTRRRERDVAEGAS